MDLKTTTRGGFSHVASWKLKTCLVCLLSSCSRAQLQAVRSGDSTYQMLKHCLQGLHLSNGASPFTFSLRCHGYASESKAHRADVMKHGQTKMEQTSEFVLECLIGRQEL